MIAKKLFLCFVLISLLVGNFIFAPRAEAAVSSRKIIIYRKNATEEQKTRVVKHISGKLKKRVRGAVHMDIADLTADEAAVLVRDGSSIIERIEIDAPVKAFADTMPWGVDRIDADRAQAASATGQGVRVGILDTGADYSHPDLAGRIAGGYNAFSPGSEATDDNGHGTHVAGIIAAAQNSDGIVGVAPSASIYPIKVLTATGTGYSSDIIAGLNWAMQNNIQVVNMSLGLHSDVESLHQTIREAVARGMIIVAAAGNDGGSVKYPAVYPEVIAVGAVDKSDALAVYSSRGPELDVVAPGSVIYSTFSGQTYKTMSGTSMAAPHVAGTAALILAKNPASSAEAVKQKIYSSAERLGSGYLLVDAENAASQTIVSQPVVPDVPAPATPTTPISITAPASPVPAPPPAGGPAVLPHVPGTLVNANGTIWRMTETGREGFDSAEKFLSHRYNFASVISANSGDMARPDQGLALWGDGVLFNDSGTIYQVSGGDKHGFTSVASFLGLGFRFENVIPGRPSLPVGAPITGPDKHLTGTFVVDGGTVYLMTAQGLRGIPSPEVLWSWGGKFSDVVPIKSADKTIYTANLTIRML